MNYIHLLPLGFLHFSHFPREFPTPYFDLSDQRSPKLSLSIFLYNTVIVLNIEEFSVLILSHYIMLPPLQSWTESE